MEQVKRSLEGLRGRTKEGKKERTLKLDLLGPVNVGGISQDADGHSGSGNVGELDSSRESKRGGQEDKDENETESRWRWRMREKTYRLSLWGS